VKSGENAPVKKRASRRNAIIIVALITAAVTIVAIVLVRVSPGPPSGTPSGTPEAVFPIGATPPSSTAAPTYSATYSDIRGTYSLYYQRSGTGTIFGATLQITQQNQQNFQGTLTNSTARFPINNGTVYQNGDIRFVIIESDSAGNQITITYTGTGEAGTGWQGTWSGSNGTQGTWYTTGRLFMP